jgi:hypothetical protein
MSEFKVDAEFEMHAAQAQIAFQEAAAAEQDASLGCNLPVGTTGKAVFCGGTAGVGKAEVVNGQPRPGKPYAIMNMEVLAPEAAKGKKYGRYFDFLHHEKYSEAQKLCDFLDFMQDAGMPKEVRAKCVGTLRPAFEWASSAPPFAFTVISGYRGRTDYAPIPDVSGGIPLPTATSALFPNASPTIPPAPADSSVTPAAPSSPAVPAGPTVDNVAEVVSGTPPAPASAPPPAPAPAPPVAPTPFPTSPAAPPTGLQPGATVTLYGQQFELVATDGKICTVKNPENGQVMANIPVAQIT